MTQEKRGFFARLGDALRKTRGALTGSISDLLRRSARVEDALHEFESRFEHRRDVGDMPDDESIARRLAEWEEKYC